MISISTTAEPTQEEVVKSFFPHEDGCGYCDYGRISREERERVLAAVSGEWGKVDWAVYETVVTARWRATKYYRLYLNLQADGGDFEAFKMECEARGWEP